MNNLVSKYSRGDSYEHSKFTTSIYPHKLAARAESLPTALVAFRERHPELGVLCVGTRVRINKELRERLAQHTIYG